MQLKEMIDHHNIIGHETHRVTIDIGAYLNLAECGLPSGHKISRYGYPAVQHIQKSRKNIERRTMERSSYSELPFNTLAFDATEQIYLKGIKRLERKVNARIDKLNITIGTTNKIIRNIPRETIGTIQPDYPKNRKSNGTFGAEGAKGVLMLYDAKAAPFAASYIMRMSYRTALKWYKEWVEKQARK